MAERPQADADRLTDTVPPPFLTEGWIIQTHVQQGIGQVGLPGVFVWLAKVISIAVGSASGEVG